MTLNASCGKYDLKTFTIQYCIYFQLEKQLADTVASKDAEIADKDLKLSRLKAQMADALKGNSW